MKKTLLFLLISSVVLIVSCKKDKTTPAEIPYVPVTQVLSTSLAGLGSHGGTPVGTAWNFPANVKVVGKILGGDPGKAPFTGKKSVEEWASYVSNSPKTTWVAHGIGVFVTLYMKLHNTSPSPTSFILPAGLMFCNDSTPVDTAQTGVIVVSDTIVIPGGDTLNISLKSFCCNPSRHVPTSLAIYKPQVVTTNEQVVHLIAALKGKTTLPTHESDILSYIWQIVGGTPLTEADLATIASWQ